MKLDGLGKPLRDDAWYYIQDTRSTVGNCALWWRTEAKGYTCDIDAAGQFRGVYARGLDRATDVPWPAEAIEAGIVRHVRLDRVRGT